MHHVKTLIIFLAGLFLMTTGFSQSPREVQVIKLADNFVFPEGPVWHPGGYLLFSDVHDFKIIRVNPDGTNSVWLDKKIKTNGLILSNDKKKIYACGHSLLSPLEIDLKTREYKVLANQFEGKPFNNVNDVALDKKGNIFFTDPTWSKNHRRTPGSLLYQPSRKAIVSRRVGTATERDCRQSGPAVYLCGPFRGE